VQAIDVALKNNIPVDLIAARSSIGRLEEQIRLLKPRICAVTDERAAKELSLRVKDTNTRIYAGNEGLTAAIDETAAPVAVNAIIGEAGLLPTLSVIKAGKRLALSNKESLVIAGELVMREAKNACTEIIPVDSEHSAIFQALLSGKSSEVNMFIKILGVDFLTPVFLLVITHRKGMSSQPVPRMETESSTPSTHCSMFTASS